MVHMVRSSLFSICDWLIGMIICSGLRETCWPICSLAISQAKRQSFRSSVRLEKCRVRNSSSTVQSKYRRCLYESPEDAQRLCSYTSVDRNLAYRSHLSRTCRRELLSFFTNVIDYHKIDILFLLQSRMYLCMPLPIRRLVPRFLLIQTLNYANLTQTDILPASSFVTGWILVLHLPVIKLASLSKEGIFYSSSSYMAAITDILDWAGGWATQVCSRTCLIFSFIRAFLRRQREFPLVFSICRSRLYTL